MNNADKNVKMYACKKATNNSSKLSAVAPNTLAGITPNQFCDLLRMLCSITEVAPIRLTGKEINHLVASSGDADAKSLETIFRDVSADPQSAARQTQGYLQSDGKAFSAS